MQAKEIADLLEKELNAGKLYENKIRAEKASLEAELTLILQRFEDDTTTSRNNMTKV
jgi:hypothetical protein